MEFEKMLTVEQCAAYISAKHPIDAAITPIAVYKAIQDGKLPVYRFGRKLAIYSADADAHWPNGKIKMGRPRKPQPEGAESETKE